MSKVLECEGNSGEFVVLVSEYLNKKKTKTIKKTKTGKDKPRSKCEGNSGEFVELVPEKLNYLGPKDLTQYFIRSKDAKK